MTERRTGSGSAMLVGHQRGDLHQPARRPARRPTTRRSSSSSCRRRRVMSDLARLVGRHRGAAARPHDRAARHGRVRRVPPGTGTSCTTTPTTSPPSRCPRPSSTGRSSARCWPSSCRTGSGPQCVRAHAALPLQERSCSPARPSAARATVTAVERRRGRRRPACGRRRRRRLGTEVAVAPAGATVVARPRGPDAVSGRGVAIVGAAECDLGVTGRSRCSTCRPRR